MSVFIFDNYEYDPATGLAQFKYSYESFHFCERVTYQPRESYNKIVLERALFLAFILIGTSYYKAFPTPRVLLRGGEIDQWQSDFFNKAYQEGLSQFAFENHLKRDDLAHFSATTMSDLRIFEDSAESTEENILALQSGGKDSLLTAALLKSSSRPFTSWYLTSSPNVYPELLDDIGGKAVLTAHRSIDRETLSLATESGAKNGHVPVTYIVQSLAVIQAVLNGNNQILVSVAHEGEEPHAYIGDLPVNHQWSKTWQAEKLFAEYVHHYISPNIKIGSPLRSLTELRVAELFASHAWPNYGHRFSSCNRSNYEQGVQNQTLRWCGECPKCANSFLLFAPFIDAEELKVLFGGRDLFTQSNLQQTFKGLLGVDDVMKPFECIGEIDELRYAYQLAQNSRGYGTLSFPVSHSEFDYARTYEAQKWTSVVRG